MAYELTGKIKLIQDLQTFASGFSKREMVITTAEEKFPQEINFEFLQDKAELLNAVQVGQTVKVTFDIRGREYNGRYYNSLVAWKLETESSAGNTQEPPFESYSIDDVPF